MAKARIRFLRRYVVQAEGGAQYDADQVVSLDAGSAEHFIKRGVAEPATGRGPGRPSNTERVPADTTAAGEPGPAATDQTTTGPDALMTGDVQ